MKERPGTRQLMFWIAVLLALQSGCAHPTSTPTVVRTVSPEDLSPPAKVGSKIAPRRFDSVRDLLAQTAALVEGEVFDISYSFEDCAGPRTRVRLREARSLLGSTVPPELELKVFGGPLPNGLWAEVSELPQFALHSRYIIFLRNTDWTYAPILGTHAYRLETIAGKPLLISQEGQAVTGFTDQGVETATVQLTEPVGRSRRSMKHAAVAPSQVSPREAISGSGSGGAALRPKDGTSSVSGPVIGSDIGPVGSGRFGPTAEQIVASGRHTKPTSLPVSEDAVRSAISLDQFVVAIRQVADRENIRIGGTIEFDPLWRCWSMTPESNLGGLR